MKITLTLLIFLSLIVLLPVKAADNNSLIINEIMPDPDGNDSTGEWIEIFNPSQNTVDLASWKLGNTNLPSLQVDSQEYILLARNADFISNQFPDTKVVQVAFSLANSGGQIAIYGPDDTFNEFHYSQATSGVSFEKHSGSCNTISKHAHSHTAGLQNTSCEQESEDPSVNNEAKVITNAYIHKLMAQPVGESEWIELFNDSSESVDFKGWYFVDAAGGKAIIGNYSAAAKSIIRIPSGVSLNNNEDTIYLYDPQNNLRDVFSYKGSLKGVPIGTSSLVESIELETIEAVEQKVVTADLPNVNIPDIEPKLKMVQLFKASY